MKRTVRSADLPTEDVGLAHHRIGGWRYVLIELTIVTAGLFIALMLNSVVEWTHHKQLVRDARRNIHKEIEDNRDILRRDIGLVHSSLADADENIATLQQIKAGRADHPKLGYASEFSTFNQTAWQTAQETGALSYMPYDEVQRYSDLYGMIAYVNERAVGLVSGQTTVLASAQMGYDLRQLPQGEVVTMLRGSAQSKMGYANLLQLLKSLDVQLAKQSAASQEE